MTTIESRAQSPWRLHLDLARAVVLAWVSGRVRPPQDLTVAVRARLADTHRDLCRRYTALAQHHARVGRERRAVQLERRASVHAEQAALLARGDSGHREEGSGAAPAKASMTRWKQGRLIVSWCLGLCLAHMFVRMGWIKFDPEGFWTAAFVRWGYPPWLRIAVGIVEVAGGAMLVVPWLASPGGLAVAFIMGGAWLTRYLDGRYVDVAWITVYGLSCLWIAYEWWAFRIWRPRH